MYRSPAACVSALVALALTAAPASATDYFATPDESKITSADTCLSEATPCALGKALETVPGVPSGTNPNGLHTLTLLPGTYDNVDVKAGAPLDPNGRIQPPIGLTIQGKAGVQAPLVTTTPASGDAIFEFQSGGALRNIRVERTTPGPVVFGRGRFAQPPFPPVDVPFIADRLTAISSSATGSTSYAGTFFGPTTITNSRFAQAAPDAAAIGLSPDDGEQIKLVGVTATSSTARALEITGGSRTGFTSDVTVANSILRGATDLYAESDAFNASVPQPFVPGTINVHLVRDAVRLAGSTTVTKGPVVIDEQGPTITADPQLGADGTPAAGSPVIDAGIASPLLGTLDLLGNARTGGSAPDLGAIEFQAPAPAPTPTPIASPAATPQPSGGSPTLAADLTAPQLTLLGGASLSRTKLTSKKGLRLAATTSEAISGATLQLLMQKKGKKGKVTETILATAELKATPAGPLTFVLKAKASRIRKGAKATLRLTATDAAGNAAKLERSVTIR